MEFDLFSGAVIAIVAGGLLTGLFNIARVKRNGIEAEAYVTRLEEHESTDSDGDMSVYYDVYVLYTTKEGRRVEAALSNPKNRLTPGDRVTIKYLPGKEEQPVFIKMSER